GAPPADPSNITSTVTSSNAVTLTWTPGAGSAGSLVLLKQSAIPNRVKPAPGLTYTGNTNFQSTANLFGGGARIIYAGTDTNVTITGLSGSNNTYIAAV